jgi:hypothetical protein
MLSRIFSLFQHLDLSLDMQTEAAATTLVQFFTELPVLYLLLPEWGWDGFAMNRRGGRRNWGYWMGKTKTRAFAVYSAQQANQG